MPRDMALECRCGRVRAVAQVSPRSVIHLICYCDDCQAFARQLERPDVLDAAGGTAVCHVAPARMRITQGEDAIRCLRLSEKGMHRFYSECCRTPIASTLSGRLPFMSLSLAFAAPSSAAQRESLLGAPTGIMARFAVGEVPSYAHAKAPLGLIVRIFAHVLGFWVSGEGQPHPLFDARGAPRAKPYVLTASERDALRPPASGPAPTVAD